MILSICIYDRYMLTTLFKNIFIENYIKYIINMNYNNVFDVYLGIKIPIHLFIMYCETYLQFNSFYNTIIVHIYI